MKIRKEDLQELYPLTRMQEGMLFHALREPASPAYTEQVVWRVSGPFDAAQYQRAWDFVHQRYEALRSVFTHEKTRQPLQLVLKERRTDFVWHDLQALPPGEPHQYLLACRAAEREQPFDLGSGPLLRVRVYALNPALCEIIVTWHHILLDGWSTHRLFQDLLATYVAFGAGKEPSLPALPAYANYVDWLEKQDAATSLAWWQTQLQDYEGIAEIPRPPGHECAERGLQKLDFRLDATGEQALQRLLATQEVTASSVLQTLWGLLLGRYCDCSDVVFGAVVSGRSPDVADIEHLPGLLINTVPVRVRFDVSDTFSTLLQRVHRQALAAQAHQACRLADIQNATEQRGKLIRHLLVFENYPVSPLAQAESGGPRLEVIATSEPTSYDLLLVADPSQGLRLEFQYNAAVYDAATIRQLAEHGQRLLQAALTAPDTPLRKLELLHPDERQSLIDAGNAAPRDYPRDSSLADVFATILESCAQRPAIVHSAGSISYAELAERSARLANFLLQKGVQPGERVLVLLDRSPAMVEAILAIARLGAIYVPHDPEGPPERLHFVLADAGIRTVILRAAANPGPQGVNLIYLDADASAIAACPTGLPQPALGDEACVFYTSGSTGQPKGVRVPRRGILRMVCNPDYMQIDANDRIGHLANVAFDAACFEIWSALLNGAALHIIDRDTALNPGALARLIREQKLSTLFLTTSLFNQMARDEPAAFAPLRTLLIGGEAADPQWLKRVLERGAPQRLVNAYGPTEATTFATSETVTQVTSGMAVPIGRPISHTVAYVVDRELRLQPTLAPGELLLGGDGIALGYLNRPKLTAEHFIADPFQAGGIIYRTGDIVRRLPDGRLEFIGRRDQQVKLRGFRIELGEIEAALRDFPQVAEALVIITGEADGGQRKLVAYLGMSEPPANIDLSLRRHLRQRLPDYMIPAAFVILDRLPLTANGKIDRCALPLPTRSGTGFGKAFIAPVGELEQQLAGIWASVLGITHVGRSDNFFELGGHSLSASTSIAHIRATLRVDIALPFFFQCPSLQALAEEVARLQQNTPLKTSGITRVARHPGLPGSPDT